MVLFSTFLRFCQSKVEVAEGDMESSRSGVGVQVKTENKHQETHAEWGVDKDGGFR
jgi:hypothetical protein